MRPRTRLVYNPAIRAKLVGRRVGVYEHTSRTRVSSRVIDAAMMMLSLVDRSDPTLDVPSGFEQRFDIQL